MQLSGNTFHLYTILFEKHASLYPIYFFLWDCETANPEDEAEVPGGVDERSFIGRLRLVLQHTWQGSGTLHCTFRPRQPSARWTRLVSALAVVQDTTQRIRRCRGVSLRTTTPWRRSLQRYRHPSTWLAVSEYDAIPSTESEWVSECVDLYSA